MQEEKRRATSKEGNKYLVIQGRGFVILGKGEGVRN